MSSTPLLLAAGDIHLDHWIWRRHRTITGDAQLGFDQLIELALRYRCPLVIVGDLFDTVDPDSSLVSYFRQCMDRLQRESIACYAIQGNHDRRPIP